MWPPQDHTASVSIDNDSDPNCTLLLIEGANRPGLLGSLTSTFAGAAAGGQLRTAAARLVAHPGWFARAGMGRAVVQRQRQCRAQLPNCCLPERLRGPTPRPLPVLCAPNPTRITHKQNTHLRLPVCPPPQT